MNRLTGLAVSAGILMGAAGCGEAPKFYSTHFTEYTADDLKAMNEHMQADLESKPGILLHPNLHPNNEYRVPFQGDQYTPPTAGLRDGQMVPYDKAQEVDFGKPDYGKCIQLRLPSDASKLDIKVVQNNSHEPLTAKVGGTALQFCHEDGIDYDATAVVQVTQHQS